MRNRIASCQRAAQACLCIAFANPGWASPWPDSVQAEYLVREAPSPGSPEASETRLRYWTMGTPARDETGLTTNAVLVLPDENHRADQLLSSDTAKALFAHDGALDTNRFFIVVPDTVDEARSRPQAEKGNGCFTRAEMDYSVSVQYRVVLEHLGVTHLRLIVGSGAAGSQAWTWAWRYPYFVDALMLFDCLASQPERGATTGGSITKQNDAAECLPPSTEFADVASHLGAVRAEAVVVASDREFGAERQSLLARELAYVRNGRYVMVSGAASKSGRGAFAVPAMWLEILDDLLLRTQSH